MNSQSVKALIEAKSIAAKAFSAIPAGKADRRTIRGIQHKLQNSCISIGFERNAACNIAQTFIRDSFAQRADLS
jgi:hypothetical protein